MLNDTATFLQTNHISKQIRSGDSEIVILRDVNLTINKAESIAILGASGSGKTTLMTLLAGLDVPTSGDIYFEAQHLNKLSEEQRALLRAKKIGIIFQNFRLLPTLTALENVMLLLEIQYVAHQQAKQAAITWLQQVGLQDRMHHYPAKLSGGEQQRVAIARAFINRPSIIFADEMTGNLDTETGKKIADILFSLNREQHTTLVLVTHDDHLAARCAKRYLLSEGVLQAC